MALNKDQLKELIEETLQLIDMHSKDAVNLLMGTAAQESNLGTYMEQLGNGPAKGIFQMEPATFDDIVANWLRYDPVLHKNIVEIVGKEDFNSSALTWHLRLAIIMCRLHYRRVKEKMPTNVNEYAAYWKKYYNTVKGKGTEQEFIQNYKKYVL